MRCLVAHKWVTHPRYLDMVFGSDVAYRRCTRCGKTQYGVLDSRGLRINWSTMREIDSKDVREVQALRGPSSRLSQIAHALGLRRTRETDHGEQEGARS